MKGKGRSPWVLCTSLDSMGPPLHAKHHVSLKSSFLRLPQEYKLLQKPTWHAWQQGWYCVCMPMISLLKHKTPCSARIRSQFDPIFCHVNHLKPNLPFHWQIQHVFNYPWNLPTSLQGVYSLIHNQVSCLL